MVTNNIIKDIAESIEKNSNRNAFFIQGEYYTYKELSQKTASIYNQIKKYAKHPQCIAIVEANNIETYASILAVLFSGNTYVIINPLNPKERNKIIIDSTSIGIGLIFGNDNLVHLSGVETIINSKECTESIDFRDIEIINHPKGLAYIIFTSGSTGIPKGVPISHNNLNAFYQAYSKLGFQLSADDKMLQMFDLCFDVSVVSTLYPLTLGACVYTVAQDGVKYTQVYELLEDEELTFAAIPPSLLSYLRPYFDEIELPKLKYLILTAEASNWDLLAEFKASIPNAQMVNLYGPTEATIYCTSYLLDYTQVNTYNGMLAIGKPFSGIDIKIINPKGEEVATGEKGELCVSGNQIMDGYWKNADKTNEVFVCFNNRKPYYKTGDICFLNEEGCLFYCGRKDYQVQIQGFRVELNEIEYVAGQYHNQGNNVVVAKTNPLGNQELHLFVDNFKGDIKKLRSFIEEKLPPYMCPKQIYVMAELPLNTSGKIDRKKLLENI